LHQLLLRLCKSHRGDENFRERDTVARNTPMTIAYEEARELMRRAVEPAWNIGTFCLDDSYIVENDEMFVFSVGAREYLVDDNLGLLSARSSARCSQGKWPLGMAAFPRHWH
jgi:hypothetical protein